MVNCGDGRTAHARAYNVRIIEPYEEETRGNRRPWGFINLTKRLHMHASCFLCTQTSTPQYTQSFIHLAPGCYCYNYNIIFLALIL